MKIVIPLIWIASLICAFMFGRLSLTPSETIASTPQILSNTELFKNQEQAIPAVTGSALSTGLPAGSEAPDNAKALHDPQKAVKQIQQQLVNMVGQDFAVIAKAYGMLESFNEQQLKDALDYLVPYANNNEYNLTMTLFLGQYASTLPSEAMQYISSNINDTEIRLLTSMQVLSKWADKDPISALGWYNNNPQSSNRFFNQNLSIIFSGLAGQDINLAIDRLSDLSNNANDMRFAAVGIAMTLNESSEFINLIENISVLDDKTLNNSIYSAWLRKDDNAVVSWFDTIENPDVQTDIQDDIFNAYMFSKPEAAANWYISRAEPQSIDSKAAKVVETWSRSDPESALNWINKQPGLDTQSAIYKLLKSGSYGNANFVINNLELLDSDKQKADVSYNIYSGLERQSEQRARDFLQASPYKPALLTKIARMKAYRDERKAKDQ